MIYWDLFFGFLRVGCFAFGGAYGAIPLIREVALSYGWLDDEAISYMIAVSESTPGPIMINLATYVGSSQAGLWGAVLATLAVVLPSFLIILLAMAVLKTLFQNRAEAVHFQHRNPLLWQLLFYYKKQAMSIASDCFSRNLMGYRPHRPRDPGLPKAGLAGLAKACFRAAA